MYNGAIFQEGSTSSTEDATYRSSGPHGSRVPDEVSAIVDGRKLATQFRSSGAWSCRAPVMIPLRHNLEAGCHQSLKPPTVQPRGRMHSTEVAGTVIKGGVKHWWERVPGSGTSTLPILH